MLTRTMTTIVLLVTLSMAAILVNGCGKSSSPLDSVAKLYKPTPDKNVTADPKYNFSPFAGTVWKTKVKVAVVELKRYSGANDTKLLVPERFDSAHPRYNPPHDMQMISVLPEGTILRIEKLLEDQGAWGGVQVQAMLVDSTNFQKSAYLDPYLLNVNRFNQGGPFSYTNWGVNPELLEEVKAKSVSTP